MTTKTSERRRKTKVIGIRMEPAVANLLKDRASRARQGHCEYARKILEDHLVGAGSVENVARNTLIVADADRALLGDFTRHAGRLTGALIQAAMQARLHGDMPRYHEALERLLTEVKDAKATADRLIGTLNA